MAKKCELNAKQQLFVVEYIVDWNGTQAAIRAGYSGRSARKSANDLLQKPAIQTAIASELDARIKRVKVDADWVLNRLVDEADADLADLYDDSGNLLPVKQWPKVWRKGLVAGIEVSELFEGYGKDRKQCGEVKKLRLVDRTKLVELVGKHIAVQAFRDQVGLSNPKGGPIDVRVKAEELSDDDLAAIASAGRNGVTATETGPH